MRLLDKEVQRLPLVVVCGGTGTGKSRLAIEIAEHFGGEVINSDALQVYKGLDIATNKVTFEETQRVRHHLLGTESPTRLDYNVHDFQDAALKCIGDLKMNGKMPVLVGGTNYYLESVLWKHLIDVTSNSSEDETDRFESLDNKELYNYLQSVDPQSALLIHPNTRRKVLRAIEISLNSDKSQHYHLKDQDSSRRFPLSETVFIWVNSEKESLFPRLEKRVEEMVKDGLLPELEEMQQLYLSISPPPTYMKGIFQAIGFKEFHNYLNFEEKQSDEGRKILTDCIERLKLANKQYVKTQNKWIKNRFLRESAPERNIPLFKVDSSDVSKWQELVFQRSIDIIEEVRQSKDEVSYNDFVAQLTIKPEPLSARETFTPCYNVCETCDHQVFISLQTWNAHMKSKRHERRMRSERKKRNSAEGAQTDEEATTGNDEKV